MEVYTEVHRKREISKLFSLFFVMQIPKNQKEKICHSKINSGKEELGIVQAVKLDALFNETEDFTVQYIVFLCK